MLKLLAWCLQLGLRSLAHPFAIFSRRLYRCQKMFRNLAKFPCALLSARMSSRSLIAIFAMFTAGRAKDTTTRTKLNLHFFTKYFTTFMELHVLCLKKFSSL